MKKFLSMMLAVVMTVSMLPLSGAFAASSRNSEFGAGLQTVSTDVSQLAPGITLNEVVAYDKNGDRVEMYVTTADSTVDTVKFYANYKDNQYAEWGMQTLSEQVAAMEAKYDEPFKVVAGLNASYYDVNNGRPTGAFAMEGVLINSDSAGNGHSFFAVLKDGSVMIGAKGEYTDYKDQIKEAIGGYIHLVKDGQVCAGLDNTAKYPRQTIGITADGKVIIMTADGSQAPKTIGLTIQEQAEVMLQLGCVEALHLDGGNSATFGGIREGTDKFVTINTPSGQVERAVSNTLMIVSTAVSTGEFDHAIIEGKYDYFAPNSSYEFSLKGVDAAGGPATVPNDTTWTLSDNSFGVMSGSTFISNGKLGDVTIQVMYNGKVVGKKTISVVNPESISFGAEEKTAPYGKTISLTVTALYANNEICCDAGAFNMTVKNALAGSLEGFDFTAGVDETITSTTVTAAYKYDSTLDPISVTIKFGKGSEVLYDFEDGDISQWIGSDKIDSWVDEENKKYPDAKYPLLKPNQYSNPNNSTETTTFLADGTNGTHIKNGNYALGVTIERNHDIDVNSWSYNYLYFTGAADAPVWRDIANGKTATRIGMWLYFPEESRDVRIRICHTFEKAGSDTLYSNFDNLNSDFGSIAGFKAIPEDGWVYVYFNLANYPYESFLKYSPTEDYAHNNGKTEKTNVIFPAFLQFINIVGTSHANNITFYIDDITLDYSDVTEDRDAPTITDPTVAITAEDYAIMNGQEVTSNKLSFSATIAEQMTKANYTGLDYSTAKIYIDGKDYSDNAKFKASGNVLAVSDVYLVNGIHEVVFVIADKQGNYTRLTKTIVVKGTDQKATVTISGHNDGEDIPKADSLYYIDIKASDASGISNIQTSIKLFDANKFELDHIIAAEGVEFTYEFDALNSTITLNITSDGTVTGEATLVSIPVRVWSWDVEKTGVSEKDQLEKNQSPAVKIQCEVVLGDITYADGTKGSFYGTLDVQTEMVGGQNNGGTVWHQHTASPVDDLPATCTDAGYEGRTYCDVCKSVVDWGTTVPATGHSYQITDGVLKCVCGEAFTGVWEDGKAYVDGVVITDGWVEDSYFVNGVKLTGVCLVEGFYYDFGENGICENKVKYTGLVLDGDTYRYAKVGVLSNGWILHEDEWYYFDASANAATPGAHVHGPVTYEFENTGKLKSGVWAKTLFGIRYYYGPTFYAKNWQIIDGKDYYFENGYAVTGGYQQILNLSAELNWYYFNEDGSCDKTQQVPDGFYTDRNGYGYSKDGYGAKGLQLIDGVYYYFDHRGHAMTGTHAGRLFGEDYKAYTGIWEEDGILYLYDNGRTASYGLFEVDGAYYYSYWGGVIKTSGKYYVGTTYCDLPAGNYTFGADGKMLNGIATVDGDLYLYIDGETATYGLYEIDGSYYYADWGGALKTDGRYYVSRTYCDLPADNYTFGADGKMLNGVVEQNGQLYLYKNGSTETCGLFEVDGEYYYSYWGGVLKTDGRYYVSRTYCDLPAGNYTFGADGKMLNGVVEVNGQLYLYINGETATYGLYEIDGSYYFADWGGILKTDGRYYVSRTYCDLAVGNYTFGADGKMFNGVVEVDGVKYLYFNGSTASNGLYNIDGKYYYSDWGGVLNVDGRYYVSTTQCDLPAGKNYTFGADGAMLDGFVTIEGTIYYYENGSTPAPGIILVNGDYYYVTWGGVVVTNGTHYVAYGNGYTIPMNYKFDATGKIIG